MSVETQDIDKGFKALLKELRALDNDPFVKVGFTKPDNHKESGESLLLIASSNEFGTSDGRIPERSFMRSTADRIRDRVSQMVDKGYDKIINRKSTVKKILDEIGLFVTAETQKTIAEIDSPANSEKTINKKGSSNPLVDTGFMRQSVKHEVRMDGRK